MALAVGVIVASLVLTEAAASAATGGGPHVLGGPTGGGPHVLAGIGTAIADWVIEATVITFDSTIGMMQRTYEPDLTSPWFSDQFELMRQVGTVFIVPFLMVATIGALLKGGLREVLHTYLVIIPVALLGAIVAVALVRMAQAIDSNLTDEVLAQGKEHFLAFRGTLGGDDPEEAGLDYSKLVTIFVLILFPMMILGLLFMWFELILREITIYLGLLFLPIAMAVAVWKGGRRWAFMLMEIVLVMIFSKFVMMAALTLGFTFLTGDYLASDQVQGSTDDLQRISAIGGGTIIIFMAVFAMPAMIGFVMAPNFSPVGRKEVGASTPLNADNRYVRQRAKDTGREAAGVAKKVGGAIGKLGK